MPMLWFNPDPRFVIELSGLHVSRSLRKVLRQQRFEIRFDSAFSRVVAACAAPRSDESGTWIDHRIAPAFVALHEMGGLDGVRAHSVEAWREGVLVGGLYGIAVGGVFSGESMFMRESNASKVALVALVERMIARGFTLLDCQVYTEHFESMGGIEVARAEYLSHLEAVVDHDCRLV
jgi:leucyl/phenylalanyl-tRNA--protein transferase